ncbi:glycosyltransferase [Bacteroides fragilis]|nr:glycosyltransferase [Bacteroides fragilis]
MGGALVQKFTRCRFFYTEHSTSNKRRNKKYLRFIEQKVYRSYDKIISISNQTEINLLQWLDLNKISKFIVVENGIDLQKFRKSYESILPKTSINLLMISRFTKAKDHSTIISCNGTFT